MGGPLQCIPMVLAAALALSPLAAWAPETRVRMLDEAVRLMPASLRLALEHHREELLRGMLVPMVDEDGPRHRPAWVQGSLDATVDAQARSLLETLGRPAAPFSEIAASFGTLAHYVADAGFPPGASRNDGAARYVHFSRFCEERRGRFPVVFQGHDDPLLAEGDWGGFARRELERAGDSDRDLSRAYAAAGEPPDPAAFDDRSVPFAVGSLSYSRSINNITRVWLNVWRRAQGDMSRLPYGKAPPPPDP